MELGLIDVMKVIRKRIWLITIMIIVACLTTAIVSYYVITPVYQASTKLIVNKPNEASGMNALTINDVNLNIRIIDTYKEVIKTSYIMDMVAKEYPQFQMTSEQLIGAVTVSSVNNTQVMTLSVQDSSYEKAADIVNAVSQVFQREIPKVMQVDNVSILTEAKVETKPAPVNPKPKLNIALAFMVSLMASAAIAFLLEYLDDTVKSEAELEKIIGIPNLSTIVRITPDDLGMEKTIKKSVIGENAHVNATANQ